MAARPLNVLFLCTGNSARSIFAECLINRLGCGRFRGYSAGSYPRGEVEPLAICELQQHDFETAGLRSKDWSEFARADAPSMDFVFTVCDKAAAEVCPVWPGRPVTANWGIPDPAAAMGEESVRKSAFHNAYIALHQRISRFVDLPIDALDEVELQRMLEAIGRTPVENSG